MRMYCPSCKSTFSRIITNTDFYTCMDCGVQFGYVVGSKKHCPQCTSIDLFDNGSTRTCMRCGCVVGDIDDEFKRIPHVLMFPKRQLEEFYRRQIHDRGWIDNLPPDNIRIAHLAVDYGNGIVNELPEYKALIEVK